MSDANPAPDNSPETPVVVVTGANGLVGARTCALLQERGAVVRAVVRRGGTAPEGTEEHVGDFADPDLARRVVQGATSVVTTVHPMADGEDVQRRVAVEGTPVLARAARDAGVRVLVHLSTAAVYDRSPAAGDVGEDSPLVDDDAGTYPVTKRDTDAALADVDRITTVLVRPPAILGPGESSIWNTLRPREIREDEAQRHDVPERSFAWVHLDDLARMVADLAVGAVRLGDDPDDGPVEGGCTAVNVAGEPATARDYLGTVAAAVGVARVWVLGVVGRGGLRTDRARRWGWSPQVSLADALAELEAGLRA